MRPIAIRRRLGPLTSAQPYGFLLVQLELGWRQIGSFVRAVAKRLLLRATTRAPPVLAGFERELNR